MDIRRLKRNPAAVHADWVKLDDGRIITKKGCKIMIPARFEERGLAYLGVENYICAMMTIVMETGEYGISATNAMMNIDPTDTERVTIEGSDHLVFTFMPGSTVVKTSALVKDATLVGKIFAEMVSMGNLPWYYNYSDSGAIFRSSGKYAGSGVGENTENVEMLMSLIGRSAEDKTVYYRSTLNDQGKSSTGLAIVGLRDVVYAPSNTVNRLAGSYLDVGIVASLNNPTERMESTERVLR